MREVSERWPWLLAILNSTLVGLFKFFYGRFAGTEGNLKTEVIDVNLIEVPDPRGMDADLAARLTGALRSMSRRPVGRLVEEQLMECHLPERARRLAAGPIVLSQELRQRDRFELDEAVFELLGVENPIERTQWVQRLHEETARHFRAIRVVEIEKMQQRSGTGKRRFSVQELAGDAWDAAELNDLTPLAEWLAKRPQCTAGVNIPEERPALHSPSPMYDPNAVYFGKPSRRGTHAAHVDCSSLGQAKLVVLLANSGLVGDIAVPADEPGCRALLEELEARLHRAHARFAELADSRTTQSALKAQLVDQLMRWFIRGRSPADAKPTVADGDA